MLLVECRFTSTETVGLLGTGAQDGHLDFHTAPELWAFESERVALVCPPAVSPLGHFPHERRPVQGSAHKVNIVLKVHRNREAY